MTQLGFLILNKPHSWTSHDCVAKVRRLLRIKKVGHAGTLDPMATGVLPLAIGPATRLLQYLPGDKAYEGTIHLGLSTTTDDSEGEVIAQKNACSLSRSDIQSQLEQFIGTIQQVPPRYSAIQVQGKRLYELARAGIDMQPPARTVCIEGIKILAWQPGDIAVLKIAIVCGRGTYIRAIARDLGQRLGVGGMLAQLVRTQSNGFNLTQSLDVPRLEALVQKEGNNLILVPPAEALRTLPKIQLEADLAWRWQHGQRLVWSHPCPPVVRVHDSKDQFLGVGLCQECDQSPVLTPKLVLKSC